MSSEIFKRVWQSIVLLSFFIMVIYIPLRILYNQIDSDFLKVSYWIVNLVYLADALLNIRLLNKKDDNNIVNITHNKFRFFLISVDIISAIPFGFISGNIFLELLRLIKVIRIISYIRIIHREATRLSSYLSFVFFLYWLLIAAHLLACGWIFLHPDKMKVNLQDEYITSLYWCIQTITTVGYGDIVLSTIPQRIYAMMVMLFGVGVYGFVIGNVANILLKRDPARMQFQNSLERLRSFVNFRSIPSGLQKRIRDYYEYIWKQRLGYNESEFVSGLPDGLKKEVELFLKRDILEKIPLFKGISDKFLREVSLHLRPVVYTPGDYIFKEGDRGNEMYFVIKGKLKILSGDESKILNTLSDGDFFGELALFRDEIRMATVQAATYCDVYTLNKGVFEHVLNNYPDISSQIKKVAEARLKNS